MQRMLVLVIAVALFLPSRVAGTAALICPLHIQSSAASTIASNANSPTTKTQLSSGVTTAMDATGSTSNVSTQAPNTTISDNVTPQHAIPGKSSGSNATPVTVRWLQGALSSAGAVPTNNLSTNSLTAAPIANTNGSTDSINSITDNRTSSFVCDEEFYQQWVSNGLNCGVDTFDVTKAVAASRCVIYSGTLGNISDTSCVSICSFPGCEGGQWIYGATNGIASSVYQNTNIMNFVPPSLQSALTKRSIGAAALLTTLISKQQCEYTSELSFSSCMCSKLVSNGTKSDDLLKKERQYEKKLGIVPNDMTTHAGSVLAPATLCVAGVTVFMSSVAAVASSVAGGTSAATSSTVALAGTSAAVVTIEICQFGVLLNQLQLEGKSSALALFGKQMAPSTFTFLPFGKLKDNANIGRRLLAHSTQATGIAQYSRTLGIREDMLFVVTLAGVILVMSGVVVLFGVAYVVAGLFMDRGVFMSKFFDKMIGLQVLIAILSQYTIGVTGTYQIYYSFHVANNPTDTKCILAIVALVGLAIGTLLYGYLIIRKHEDDIRDVGTITHVNKKVCMRYGPLYDEYKFKNRFFFAPKMTLALASGVATGYVGIQPKYQVSIILAAHVFFFFYLEVQSPHHSRFVQTTTSFVTIMKIATLALTFFLISATTSSDLPSDLQNAISLAIVGLNLFVLLLLLIRALYAFWKKYQLQKNASYDNVDDSAVQEYFKEETPPRRDGSYHPNLYLDPNVVNEAHQNQVPQRGVENHPSRYDAARVNQHYNQVHRRQNGVVEL